MSHYLPQWKTQGGYRGSEQAGGDNARKGAVKKRSQVKTKPGGATAWTKRKKKGGEFIAVKKPTKKKQAAKKFKSVRREK
jgi:hypothetical protein